jgi:Flp pilus assembly protein CpaB
MIARRVMRRPLLWFLVAGALLALTVIMVMRSSGASQGAGRVVVARVVIPAGTLLDEDTAATALALAAVPDALGLRGLVTSAAGVVGRRTVAPLGPGEPVTEAVLGGSPGVGPAPLAAGERAVPVPLRAAGGPVAAPAPGSRVDVMASDGEGPAGRTRVIVADAEVLAVTPGASGDTGEMAGGVVLRLSANDALAVAHALDFAREVRVIARPAGEG